MKDNSDKGNWDLMETTSLLIKARLNLYGNEVWIRM